MSTTFDDAGQPTLTALAARIEAATDPLSRLAEIRLLHDVLAAREAETVREAREGRAAWAAIGSQLGISKQAALKRFGERRQPGPSDAAPTPQDEPTRAVTKPRRVSAAWDVTTPGGRTLLRVRRSPAR